MGIEGAWQLDMSWVPEHVKCTVMGDWHGLPQDGETEGRKWLYTGSMCSQSISEPPCKSFLVCRRDPAQDLIWERMPLLTRPIIFNDLRFAKELEEWLEKISGDVEFATTSACTSGMPDHIAVPLVVLRYSVSISRAHERVAKVLNETVAKGRVHLRLLPNRRFLPAGPDRPAERKGKVVNVEDAINERVDQEGAPELHRLTTDLAFALDPKLAIRAFKERHQLPTEIA